MGSERTEHARGGDNRSLSDPMVVGIGASAGGLNALKTLLGKCPAQSRLALVVVVHLAPDHKSLLAELLQSHSPFPVQQVTETTRIEPGHVYVIPPNANLNTIDTHLRLSQLEEDRRHRAPIDHFFRTLARTHDGRSIGVILTGTGSDGALGVKEIKAKGGVVIVQDPNEAEHDGMPQSAISTGAVDLVLPLEEIPAALLRIAATEPKVQVGGDDGEEMQDEERQILHKVFAQVRARTGRDFSRYKRSTILRRIARRMQLNNVEELSRYLELLRHRPEESTALADDLLITVTSFFRDTEVFEHIEKRVLPEIFAGKAADDIVRIWSVGCATGEEAYSLTMLLLQEAGKCENPPRIQVFASDLHEVSLKRARDGFYPGDIETDVSQERLRRFFHKEEGGYRIRKEVREAVVFAPHNLLGNPPFSRLDLIVCRNVLIYLQREIQRDVIDLFHYALRPEGWLVLGLSETCDETELFRIEDKRLGVYRKRNVQAPEPRLPVFPQTRRLPMGEPDAQRWVAEPLSYGALHQRLVEMYAPPSLLIGADDRVVHLSERVGRYLVHPGGEPTAGVYRLIREELRLELRTALQEVREGGSAARSRPVLITIDGKEVFVALQVRPALESEIAGCVLVMFDEWPEARSGGGPGGGDAGPAVEGEGDSSSVRDLRAELDLARQRLQAIVEEYETTQEEMKASNEELQSTNEELRSTMEELETSKEELQSMNEELQTVNQENRHKVEELAQLTSDLQNLLAATDIATLFLDRDLRIMRFTPKVGELFNVRMTDRGRPLSDFTHRLGYRELLDDARAVLARLVSVEREVQDDEGHWYLARVLPYRTTEDRIGGVVITFVDITTRRQAELALRESELQYRVLVEAAAQEVWEVTTVEAQGHRRRIYAGQAPEEWLEQGWTEAIHPDDREIVRQRWERAVAVGEPIDVEFRVRGPNGEWNWTNMRGAPVRDHSGNVVKWVAMNIDVTERRRAEEAVKLADRRKEEFLAMLAHELRNPLATLRSSLSVLALDHKPETVRATREMMERQLMQLVRLIDDLVDVSRISRGMLELRRGRVDVRDLVRQVVDSCAAEGRSERRIELDLPDEPLPVLADPARMMQVFGNLLTNAIKFTGPENTIRIRAERQHDQAVLQFQDDGAGIPPDRLEWIFEAFTQADPKHHRGGLGLGLPLVRRLVALHGGSVVAHSDGPGKGCTFTVRLPLVDEAVQPKAQREHEPAEALRGLRFLIVDDDRDAADSMAMLLSNHGSDVRVAYDGEDAMATAGTFAPDVVLLDIALPKTDGGGVARWIRAQPWGKRVALVAVTGLGSNEAAKAAADAGFDEHCIKPLAIEDLRRLLARVRSAAT